jgi:plastocyanin
MGWRVLAALAIALTSSVAGAEGRVHGKVVFELPGMRLADLGPIVVYVADAAPGAAASPAAKPEIHQKNARFAPSFLAVAAGQTIAMPNDDRIYHNVFSYSKPNDFDLGLYPAGDSRSVPMRHPGVVKLYCSIHESMNGTVFVAPTRWFAVAGADGSFSLPGVPPGRHRLRTWNEKLPDTEHTIEVPAAGDLAVELSLLPGS